MHGDFNPHNIITRGSDFSVIDWEDIKIGPQEFDCLHFLMISGIEMCGQDSPRQTMENIITADGVFSKIANTIVNTYCSNRDLQRTELINQIPQYARSRLERFERYNREPPRLIYDYLVDLDPEKIHWV
jgi:hypothetical protein